MSSKQILGMEIDCDRKAKKFWLSHEKYFRRVLERVNMKNAKYASTSLASNLKWSKKSCPTTKAKKKKKKEAMIPYSSTVGSLICTMVPIRPYIA